MKSLEQFQERLEYRWNDVSLLERALTHSSFSNQNGVECNERDEFLGDAVLDILTAEYLMATYPLEREGFLSQARAELVKKCSLASKSRALGIGELLEVGKGAEYLRTTDSVLADALEAVIGAAYTDGGLMAARTVAHAAGIL